MALLNIPGYTSQPFDYQGLLADAHREARRQGLLSAGIGLLTQGPSPYPIGFLSSVGRGLAGYQAGQQAGFDTALQRGVDAAKLGMLNNEQALKLYDLQRKYDQGEELIAGLSGQPSAGMLTDGGATPGLLNQPAAPAGGALYETSRSTPASSPAQVSQPIAAPADPYTQLAQAVSMPESGGRQFDDQGQVILGPRTAAGWQAIGKMQLSPDTAKRLGVNPYNEAQNFQGGVAYLKELMQQTGGNVDEALRIYGGFQPGDPNAAGYIQKVKANLPQGWSPDAGGIGAGPGPQLAQAAPAGVQTASDQSLRGWFQSQPQAYQEAMKSRINAGADPDEVLKTIHDDMMKQTLAEGKSEDERVWATLARGVNDPAFRATPEYGFAYAHATEPKYQVAPDENGVMVMRPVVPQLPPGVLPPPGMAAPAPQTIGKKPPTEAERRNQELYSVAAPEAETVQRVWPALGNLGDQIAGNVPLFGKFFQSEEYQQGYSALKTIISTYLYSVSGATANPGEVENQTGVMLPEPGDKPAVVADKLRRVQRMVDAIRLGSGPAGIPGVDDLIPDLKKKAGASQPKGDAAPDYSKMTDEELQKELERQQKGGQ